MSACNEFVTFDFFFLFLPQCLRLSLHLEIHIRTRVTEKAAAVHLKIPFSWPDFSDSVCSLETVEYSNI